MRRPCFKCLVVIYDIFRYVSASRYSKHSIEFLPITYGWIWRIPFQWSLESDFLGLWYAICKLVKSNPARQMVWVSHPSPSLRSLKLVWLKSPHNCLNTFLGVRFAFSDAQASSYRFLLTASVPLLSTTQTTTISQPTEVRNLIEVDTNTFKQLAHFTVAPNSRRFLSTRSAKLSIKAAT